MIAVYMLLLYGFRVNNAARCLRTEQTAAWCHHIAITCLLSSGTCILLFLLFSAIVVSRKLNGHLILLFDDDYDDNNHKWSVI